MTANAPKAPTAPGVRSWWGIPYATAERYRRPVLADFDPDHPYDRKGVVSVQPDSGDWLEADSGMGEDCLNLNVWAPEQPSGKALPVAVYIHGGGFEYGANTQITSNASGLAATGRVVGVSINYRLGALGAVSLSQYGGALAEASNLCLQDVIAALTWIKQNISYFGGDPDNVTVYGHSAGAFSAFGLLGAPAANGLYRRLAGFLEALLVSSRPGGPRNTRTGSSPNSVSRTTRRSCSASTRPRWWPPRARSPRQTWASVAGCWARASVSSWTPDSPERCCVPIPWTSWPPVRTGTWTSC
ncbi:carboxylesterase family protein [Streptomyces sp. NPDC002553]|uniref:carboxylesterase family protein n=1 Tax=unclassified Streptomyces TaxID=2593676 RepID=UPI003332E888